MYNQMKLESTAADSCGGEGPESAGRSAGDRILAHRDGWHISDKTTASSALPNVSTELVAELPERNGGLILCSRENDLHRGVS